jgi:hypothetical protein
MLEVYGNLWEYEADARVITTNGTITKSMKAVLGRGCALEASMRYPQLKVQLATQLMITGNHCYAWRFTERDKILITFPVKHEWMQKADLDLITRSSHELITIVNRLNISSIVLPRPGCGNGKLIWEDEVKPILEKVLGDRFYVITFA